MGGFNWRRVNVSRRVKAVLVAFLLLSFCFPPIVFSLVSNDNMWASDGVGYGVTTTAAVSHDQAAMREDENNQKVTERVNGAFSADTKGCGASIDVAVVAPLYSRPSSGDDRQAKQNPRGDVSIGTGEVAHDQLLREISPSPTLPFLSLYRDHLLGMATRFEQGMSARRHEEERKSGSEENNEHDDELVTLREVNDVDGGKSGGSSRFSSVAVGDKSFLSKFGMVPISPSPFQDDAEEQHPLRYTLSDSYVDIPSQLVMAEDPLFPYELPSPSISAAVTANSSTSINHIFIGSISRPIALYSLAVPPDEGRRGPRAREPHQQRNKILTMTKKKEEYTTMKMNMNNQIDTGVVAPEKEKEKEEGIFIVENDDGSLIEVKTFVARETLKANNQKRKTLAADGLHANSNENLQGQRKTPPSLVTRNEILLGRKVEYLYRSQRLPPESAPWYADQFPNSIWGELWQSYRNAKLDAIIDPQSRAPCLISLLSTGNCDFYFESMEECVSRHAAADSAAVADSSFGLGDVLARHCLESDVWKNTLSRSSTTQRMYHGIPVKLSLVHESELCDVGGMALDSPIVTTFSTPAPPPYRRPFVAVVNGRPFSSSSLLGMDTAAYLRPFTSNANKGLPRGVNSSFYPTSLSQTLKAEDEGGGKGEGCVPYISPMGGPRVCRRNNALQYPIAFGVPRRNVARRLLPKLFDFSPIPVYTNDKTRALTFNDEDLMTAITSMSFYCLTAAKGGWDCGRHHEIMAAGCVPYFADVFAAPPHILSHFPMRLLRQVVQHQALGHIGYVSGAMKDSLKSIVVSSSSSQNSGRRRRVAFRGRRRGGDENDGHSSASFQHKSVFDIKSRSSADEEEMPRDRLVFHEDFKDPANLLQLRFPPIAESGGGGSSSSSSTHPLRLAHDTEDYWPLARRLLKFSQRFITAEAMVSYMLLVMRLMGPSLSSTSLRRTSANDPTNALLLMNDDGEQTAAHDHPIPFRQRAPPSHSTVVRKMLFFSRGANVWDNMGSTIITGANGLGIEITVVAHGWKGRARNEARETEEKNGGAQPPKRNGEGRNSNSGEGPHAEQASSLSHSHSAAAYHCITPSPIDALYHRSGRQKMPQPTVPWQQSSKRIFLMPSSSSAQQSAEEKEAEMRDCGQNGTTTRVEVEVDPLLSFFRYGPIPSPLLSSSSYLSSTSLTKNRNGPFSSSSSTSSSAYLAKKRAASGRSSLHGGGIPWSNRVRGGAQMLRFVSSVEELVAEKKRKGRRRSHGEGARRQNRDETTSRSNREQKELGGASQQIRGRRWSRQRMMGRNVEEGGERPRSSFGEEINRGGARREETEKKAVFHRELGKVIPRLEPEHRVGLRVFDAHKDHFAVSTGFSLSGGTSAADEARGREDAQPKQQQQHLESGSFMNSKSFSETELGNTLIEYDLIVFGFTRYGGGLPSPPHEEIRYINSVYNKATHEQRRRMMMGDDRNGGVVGEEEPPPRHEYSTASRVAVIDHSDSAIEEPETGSDTLAREVFYFSRELRRQTC